MIIIIIIIMLIVMLIVIIIITHTHTHTDWLEKLVSKTSNLFVECDIKLVF